MSQSLRALLLRRQQQPLQTDENLVADENLMPRAPQGIVAPVQASMIPRPEPASVPAINATRPRTFRDAVSQTGHPPLGAQPPRPAGVPAGAHWDATGANPDGGEWIGAAPTTAPIDLGKGSVYTPVTPEQEGLTRDRRTQPRDFVADDEAALRDLEKHKGPFWRRLAAASIRAAQAGSGAQVSPILTKREQEIADTRQRIGEGIKTRKAQADIEAGQMTDVVLDNGEVVRVPARTAGTLRSNQQRIGQQKAQQDERVRVNNARVDRWEKMDKRDRMRNIMSLYNSGALNEPELLEYAADQMGLPGAMREKFVAGRMRGAIDADGNLVRQDLQTNTVTPSLGPNEQSVKSYETTKQANLDTRQRRAIAAAQKGREYTQGQINQRAGAKGGGVKIGEKAKGEIAKGAGEIKSFKDQLTDIDERIKAANALPADWTRTVGAKAQTKNDYLSSLGRERAEKVGAAEKRMLELNELDPNNEWGSGEGGYPYRKPKAASDLNQPIYGRPTGAAGQPWSVSRWLQANPNGDVEAAKRAAKAKKYKIVE